MQSRHAYRLLEPTELVGPENEILRAEERAALRLALSRLTDDDQKILSIQEDEDLDMRALGRRYGSTPGAAATRLSRARARLRVEYVIACAKGEPPTQHCRPVLFAMSAGDLRRRRNLSASDHLAACSYCSELAELVSRRGRIPPLVPVGFLAGALQWARKRLSTGSGQTTVAVAAVAVAVATFLASSPPSELSLGEEPAFPFRQDTLAAHAGDEAVGDDVQVESVPANEAFWVGRNQHDRILVHLVGEGESPIKVVPGQRVSFEGRVLVLGEGTLNHSEITEQEGITKLQQQGHYIEVDRATLQTD